MQARLNRTKMALFATTLVLLAASYYLAHLSGRAMSAEAGDTFESLDLGYLSALAGMPAMILGVSLIAAKQTGGVLLRITKLAATFAYCFFLQIFTCFLIQSLSAQ
jgi:hypothetical protein